MSPFNIFRLRKRREIGLALGGGAVLGAAHVGVLRALEEEKIKISYIAGTSIGAFVGALYAFGKKWYDIKEIATSINWLNISGLSLSQFGLLSNRKLADNIVKHIGQVDFKDAEIPLAIVATDITTGDKVVIRNGDVPSAVTASTCIPGIFMPIKTRGKMLVDGGIVENVPISPLKEMGASKIIAVNLFCDRGKPENIIDVIINSFNYSIRETTKLKSVDADILINLNLRDYNRFDVKQVDELIEIGYDKTKDYLRESSIKL